MSYVDVYLKDVEYPINISVEHSSKRDLFLRFDRFVRHDEIDCEEEWIPFKLIERIKILGIPSPLLKRYDPPENRKHSVMVMLLSGNRIEFLGASDECILSLRKHMLIA